MNGQTIIKQILVIQKILSYCVFSLLLFLSTNLAIADPIENSVTLYMQVPQKQIDQNQLKVLKKNLLSFNSQKFLQAYQIFLMNNNVEFAYIVAKKAVAHKPEDIEWRKRLLQTALWTNYPEIALNQYLYFINKNIDVTNSIREALKLAERLNNFDIQAFLVWKKLLKRPQDKALTLQYSKILQNQGLPQKALAFLQKIPEVEKDSDYLKELIHVAQGLDRPELTLYYAKSLWQLLYDVQSALKYSELLYVKGDIQTAYQILSIVSKKAGKNKEFWNTYADLSSVAGQEKGVLIAYKQLLSTGKMNESIALELVRSQYLSGNLESAYQDARIAYQRYHYKSLISTIVDLGDRLKKWQEVRVFVQNLPKIELEKLERKPQFALLMISIAQHLNLKLEIYRLWTWTFERWPNLALLQKSYLWYLLDEHEDIQLKFTLKRWNNILNKNPSLWLVYASALINTGRYPEALYLFLRHISEVDRSYELLTNLANLWIQTDHPFNAYYVSRKALNLLMSKVNQQKHRLSLEQHIQLVELMQNIGPVTLTYPLILALQPYLFKKETVDTQILSWALKTQNYDLAHHIEAVHRLNHQYTPPWMTLTLALVYNDRDIMARLLSKYPEILPYRDKVTAATLTGNSRLAQTYAYDGLSSHPYDQEMYKLFNETMLSKTNKWTMDTEQYSLGTIAGPFNFMSFRYFATPSLSLTPYNALWLPRTTDKEQIAWTPSLDNHVGLIVRKYIERGWISLDLGERKSMESFFTARLKWRRQLNTNTQALVSLGLHQLALETVPLSVGGMKNEAKLELSYGIDASNTLDGVLKFQQYLGQEFTFLGTGQFIQGHWQHKFDLDYPDWNLNLYGTWATFQDSHNTLSEPLKKLIPANTDPSTVFYMPVDYTEGAITFGVGQSNQKEYIHDWRFFSEAGILYSVPFGLGYLAQGGLGGSVFGRDHLAIYAQYSLNQQQAQQIYTVGIRYDNYF